MLFPWCDHCAVKIPTSKHVENISRDWVSMVLLLLGFHATCAEDLYGSMDHQLDFMLNASAVKSCK